MADGERPAAPQPALSLTSQEVARVTTRLLMKAMNDFTPSIHDDKALAAAMASVVWAVERMRPGCTVRTDLITMLEAARVTIDG